MTLAVLKAPAFDTYPAPTGIGEPELLPVIRVEPCACGEYIRQLAGDTIAAVVGAHNDTIPHRAWRFDRSPLSSPTTGDAAVDLSYGYPTRPAGEWGR